MLQPTTPPPITTRLAVRGCSTYPSPAPGSARTLGTTTTRRSASGGNAAFFRRHAVTEGVGYALVLLVALALTPGADAGGLHTGKGTVLAVDAAAGRLVVTHGAHGRHVPALDRATRIVDDTGAPIPAAPLQPGDVGREEGASGAGGLHMARRVWLRRPAWKELASPET